jgi:predicted metal-dependent peptidase
VAEAIRIAASSDSQGWVPGGWRRWAESILEPRVDWRRELAAVIRAALANVAGAADYSYRRPSRRQAAVTGVILPAMRQPVPEVAVLLDTSGSMGDDRLARALAELGGVLRAAGQRDVCLIACDSAVHEAGKRVRRVEEVRRYLTGGGGTDLREGFQAAARLRPRPQVLVVLSDCETPWPDRPPSGMQVVVARIGRGRAPDWAKVVDVEEVQ